MSRLKQVGLGSEWMNSRVGELLDVGDDDLDDRPQVAREGRAEVSAEALVQGLEGPHLVLGDALGALEVVDLTSTRRAAAAGRQRPAAPRRCRLHLPAVHRGQQGVDFGLV